MGVTVNISMNLFCRLFNTNESGGVPLHLALERKLFSHAKVLLRLKEGGRCNTIQCKYLANHN